jgi:osmoprotectant transport system substrate-binding protein
MKAGLLAALAIVAAACGRDARVVVGSKNFTEQRVLGELIAQTVEAAGMPVRRRFDLGGTFVCDAALRQGGLDVYVEYTGTALTAVLKEPADGDPKRVFDRVAAAYRTADLEWLPPLGFDNTFAMVVRADTPAKSLSEATGPARQWKAGFGYEFQTRPDGYPALQRVYELAFADIRTMDLGLLYRALGDRQIDVAAGSVTDGLIDVMGFRVLNDDRHAFPPYEAAPVVRADSLARHAGLREALTALGGTITAAEMRRMNAAVDGEHRNAADVAREWLDRRAATPVTRRRRPCRRGRGRGRGARATPRARASIRRPRRAPAARRASG